MFDIGWSELLLIGVVALIVIGPKDLPKALRTVGQMSSKLRRMAGEFRAQFDEAMREADVESLKREVQNLNAEVTAATKVDLDPFDKAQAEFREAVEGGAKPGAEAGTPASPPADTAAAALDIAPEPAAPEPAAPAASESASQSAAVPQTEPDGSSRKG
jgi:sec-independent protein translocase protein TatB